MNENVLFKSNDTTGYDYLRNLFHLCTNIVKSYNDLSTTFIRLYVDYNNYSMHQSSEHFSTVNQQQTYLQWLFIHVNKLKNVQYYKFKVLYQYGMYMKHVMFIIFGLYLCIKTSNIYCLLIFRIIQYLFKCHLQCIDKSLMIRHKRRCMLEQYVLSVRNLLNILRIFENYPDQLVHYICKCIKNKSANLLQTSHISLQLFRSIYQKCMTHMCATLIQNKHSILFRPFALYTYFCMITKKFTMKCKTTHIKVFSGFVHQLHVYNYWKCLLTIYGRFKTRHRRKRKYHRTDQPLTSYHYSCITSISKLYLLLLTINSVLCLSKYSKQINVPSSIENINLSTNDLIESYDILPTTLTHQVRSIYHFKPPDEKRPCRYRFRDDVETSALLADYVITGWPIQTYRRRFGPLYNISLLVTNILKSVQYSIFPVRVDHLLRIGQFSIFPDPGRCWINVHKNKQYIFFLRQPDWSGFSKITQLPVEYTHQAYASIVRIMRLGADPLQMRSLYHEDVLKVNEGNDLLLSCRVRGRPTPLISWYVNQTEIKHPWRLETGRGIIQKSRYLSKLQLSNVHTTDNANYTCLAENLNGHIRKSVQVIVKPATTSPPPTTTPLLSTTEMTTTSVHPCHNYCHRGHCYIIDGKPYCSCISQYRGARCDLFTPEKEENQLELLPNNEPKFDSCESGCESNLARVLLFSTIGILFSLLLIFFLCSIFQICYKKRQSTKKTNLSVKKSTASKQYNPENNVFKCNQNSINLSLPKHNYLKLSKIYLNPLFDTYKTKTYSMNTKTNPIEIHSQSTISDNDRPHHHHHHHHQHHDHHHTLYNEHYHNANIKHNCTDNFQTAYVQPVKYLSSRSAMNKSVDLDLWATSNSNFHRQLSVPSVAGLVLSFPAVKNQNFCNAGNLPPKPLLPQITKQPTDQQDNSYTSKTVHPEPTGNSLFPSMQTSKLNGIKLTCPSTNMTTSPADTISNSLKFINQCNLPLFDHCQSNYIPCSNIDSAIDHIPSVEKLPYNNNNNDDIMFNWDNTDATNITEYSNHCHYASFNRANDTEHLLHDSLKWCNSDSCRHFSINASPLISLSHSYCQQCLVLNHCDRMHQDPKNSSIQPELDSITNTSYSSCPKQSETTTQI
ncbi:unnamed protein product [Schistosoma turkestanicum]|nr:unnamed protein product [Schistosoma turkestanicum]